MTDGHLGKCKKCTRLDTKLRVDHLSLNKDFVDAEKSRHRDKYYRLGYKDKHKPSALDKKMAMDSYRAKYPEKNKSRILSQNIQRPHGMEGHHWSYNERDAKSLIFLTLRDHALLHRHMEYDQSLYMYRRTDNGQLLESRQSHIDLLSEVKYQQLIKTA